MFRYKKIAINIIAIIYVIIYIVELIKYLTCDNNIFGVYYLIFNLFVIFLLVPCAYNYKRYYSKARISKLVMIILFGIFGSYILEHIVLNIYSYSDYSGKYIKSIFIYKNILKGIIYLLLTIFTVFEFKLDKLLSSIKNSDHIDK